MQPTHWSVQMSHSKTDNQADSQNTPLINKSMYLLFDFHLCCVLPFSYFLCLLLYPRVKRCQSFTRLRFSSRYLCIQRIIYPCVMNDSTHNRETSLLQTTLWRGNSSNHPHKFIKEVSSEIFINAKGTTVNREINKYHLCSWWQLWKLYALHV